jgi:VanZ family protein
MRKFLKYYFPIAVWMGVIFYLSSITGDGQPREVDYWFYVQRKGAHVFEYFVLTILFLRVLNVYLKANYREKIIAPMTFSLLYAITDELHQQFVEGREGKLLDVGIDFLGIVLAVVVWGIWMKRRMRVKGA